MRMSRLGRILILITGCALFNLSFRQLPDDSDIKQLWRDCKIEGSVSFNVFYCAIKGYRHIDQIKKKSIISIIDFSKPSTDERFVVIDLVNKKVLYKCLCAHGRNSGDNIATTFSNKAESLMSSPGFFLTGETYSGKHGYSLRLDGLEKGINDNARSREIVIHGADYVSSNFIKKYGRIGRSWGCPALPLEFSKEIIDIISGGTCLFIYCDDTDYKSASQLLKGE